MSDDGRVYLDTSALAKWYVAEPDSEQFVEYIKACDVALVSSLTALEMRSLLARRRRMGDIDSAVEAVIYAAFVDDVSAGFLQIYSIEDARYSEATTLIARYPEHPLRTLDALHLAAARHLEADALATADTVMGEAAKAMGLAVAQFYNQ